MLKLQELLVAEGSIVADLDAEITRATTAEGSIVADLDAEITRATTAEGSIVADLDAEITRATTAEASISSDLAAEVNRAIIAEGSIASNLASEITNRTAAVTSLQNDINSAVASLTLDGVTSAGNSTTNDIEVGGITVSGNIIPDVADAYTLGSVDKPFRDLFVGPNSLYINGQQVISDNSGTIVLSADADQNVQIKTDGTGDIEFLPSGTGVIQLKGAVQTTGSTSVGGDLIVTGNLQVDGSQTIINTSVLDVEDLNITVAKNSLNAAASNNAGLTINLGNDGQASIKYSSAENAFKFDRDVYANGVKVATEGYAIQDSGVAGDILVHNGTSFVKLSKGADGQVLKLVNGMPAWVYNTIG